MEEQKNLKDMQRNGPELSFYKSQINPDTPLLIFEGEDGFWKARRYAGGKVLDMKLSQLYFGECVKIPDNKIEELILGYKNKLKGLRLSLEDKKRFSRLENKAEIPA